MADAQQPPPRSPRSNSRVEVVLVLVAAAIGAYVALHPTVVYAPTPRAVLFFLLSTVPAVLLGSAAQAKFELSLGPFVAVTSGAAAVLLITLIVLTEISKPEEKIALFYVEDASGNPVSLELPDVISTRSLDSNLEVSRYCDRDAVVLVFPEQVGEVEVSVRYASVTYAGVVRYAGARRTKLRIGTELVARGGGS